MHTQEIRITAADLRANLFQVLDQVNGTHKTVIITKYGKPVAKIVHIETKHTQSKDPLLGAMLGGFTEHGDLTEPVCDPLDWEANN